MPPLKGKTLANGGFVNKESDICLKMVGTQESYCGQQTTHSALAIAITPPKMSVYFHFHLYLLYSTDL